MSFPRKREIWTADAGLATAERARYNRSRLGDMADVFLSYARSSAKAAKLVAEALRAAGYSVWYDEDLPAHRAYSEVIEEQLETASAVLVLWSKEAVESHWVRSEANRARETRRLVQVRLDDARLPMPFDQIQCADLRGWRGKDSPAWQSVLAGIAALTASHPSAASGRIAHSGARRSRLNRRQLLISAGGLAAVAAAGTAAWQAFDRPSMSPEAQLLFGKGTEALQANDAFDPNNPAAAAQAVAFLTSATRLAPDSAAAWGALAMAYAVRKKGVAPAERAGLDARSRSAARRALDLDSRDPRAIAALRMLDPIYRHWSAAEAANRKALKIQPRMPLLIFLLTDVLGSVGRWREAASLSRQFDRTKFLIAGADRKAIINLWSAGDLPNADDAVRIAVEHWPQHPQIWSTHIAYLTYTGRPSEALALLRDHSGRPPATPDELVRAMQATATALAGQGSADDAIARRIRLLNAEHADVFAAAHVAAALGDARTALALLQGYYFGEGDWARLAPIGGDEDRQTAALFQPPMRNLWRRPDFDALLERIGLNRYWRRSGFIPDFRR